MPTFDKITVKKIQDIEELNPGLYKGVCRKHLFYLITNANFTETETKPPINFHQPIPNIRRLFFHNELTRLTCSNIIL
jgi:hypothetical protein